VRALSVMKRGQVVLGWLLIVAAVGFPKGSTAAPKAGDVAPAHVGTTLDGKPVLVTDYPGKAVIVSFWAT
jgi:hypothetical protein